MKKAAFDISFLLLVIGSVAPAGRSLQDTGDPGVGPDSAAEPWRRLTSSLSSILDDRDRIDLGISLTAERVS
jgi:hypothetical protein